MIRTALLGLGNVSRFYLEALQKNPIFQISALVDKDPKKNPTYLSLKQFFLEFDENSLDLVIVALPNHLHFEVAKRALHKGFHLIVEKPLALTVEESEQLYTLSLKRERFLVTFFHRRYNKAIQHFKPRSLPICAHARYLENISKHSANEMWYEDPVKVGGGCLMDNASNVLDLMSLFFSSLVPLNVHLNQPIFEQNAHILLAHSRGNISIELDWQYAGEKKDITFYLENGERVELDFLAYDDTDPRTKEFKGSLWHEYEVGLELFSREFFNPNKNFTQINREGVSNLILLHSLYALHKFSRSSFSSISYR